MVNVTCAEFSGICVFYVTAQTCVYNTWTVLYSAWCMQSIQCRPSINILILRLRQKSRHLANDIFKCIFFNEKFWISLNISLKLVPMGPIDNNPPLVRKIAWCQTRERSILPISFRIASLALGQLHDWPNVIILKSESRQLRRNRWGLRLSLWQPLVLPMTTKLVSTASVGWCYWSLTLITASGKKVLVCKKQSYNHNKTKLTNKVYPKKYAHGFVVLCFVVVMQSFIMNSHEVFIHIHQGCFAGTGAIVRLPQCQWSKPDGYGKISQCITTTKHSKAKTACIFLGIYCTVGLFHGMSCLQT